MGKRDRSGYSVSNTEFNAWKNGAPGARAGKPGNMVKSGGSGCLVAMAAALLAPAALLAGKRLR
jgi:hypothetical protein